MKEWGVKKGKKEMGERKFRVNQRDSVWRAGGYLVRGFSQKKNKEEVDIQEAERKKKQQNYERGIISTQATLT